MTERRLFDVGDVMPDFDQPNVRPARSTKRVPDRYIIDTITLPKTEIERIRLVSDILEKYMMLHRPNIALASGERLKADPLFADCVDPHTIYVLAA